MRTAYTLTENEYVAINAARAQLDLISGLLTGKEIRSDQIETLDLYEFLSAQTETLRDTLRAVDARYDAAKDTNNTLHYIDWLNIIKTVSGRGHLTNGSLKHIGRKLQNCVKADPDMAPIVDVWKDVMTQDGTLEFNLEPSSTDGFIIKFERPTFTPMSPKQVCKAVKRLTKAQAKADKAGTQAETSPEVTTPVDIQALIESAITAKKLLPLQK